MVKRPTLKDVAGLAHVSEMTASRVLRGVGEASAGTRGRVESAANQLGYVPNRIAGALSSRSVKLIGVVVPSISSFVFSEVLTGISEVLKNTGFQPVFGLSEYDPNTEEHVIREMLSWRPSGIIVTGLEHNDAAQKLLQNSGIPIAEVMDIDGDPIDINVGISHFQAGFDMGKTILARGYRQIGFIGTKLPLDFRAGKRLNGFVSALEGAGVQLKERALYSGHSTVALGREMTAEMLQKSPEVRCIYYSSDIMSCGGLMHCIAENISVPDHLALAGFNGLDLRLGMPKIPATTNAFRLEIGRKAAELVLAAHKEGKRTNVRYVFEPTIDIGQTL